MLENRVDPWGKLCRVPDYGTLMGNRGILHNADKKIVRQSAHEGWVTCLLKYKDIKRPKPFSTLNNYSELFFLDEATAFSAGHRPCHFCQRKRANLFKAAWVKANAPTETFVPMSSIDSALHAERTHKGSTEVRFDAPVDELPMGSIFEADGAAFLVAERGYLPWSFKGYGEPTAFAPDLIVEVLTPRSVVNAFKAGFAPDVHPSAG